MSDIDERLPLPWKCEELEKKESKKEKMNIKLKPIFIRVRDNHLIKNTSRRWKNLLPQKLSVHLHFDFSTHSLK